MKLYATTTSERASKGQGGNEYLNTVITVNEKEVAKIEICRHELGYKLVYYFNGQKGYTNIPDEKGKSQKGEGCIYEHEHGKDCVYHN